ncbi:YdcF family protein [Pedobacter sp. HDW13]|uniref:YdcF family protein n=1 Tax=Pedobacter sp. HDW13 TaxID=2714940 RepID=UPI001409A3A2|nr:YdcF family protein [Pedobacter sp. HDW13]QIL40933.1 YdcF family protein [Pedobacter sp. HDW13]
MDTRHQPVFKGSKLKVSPLTKAFIILIVLWFSIHTSVIIIDGMNNTPQNADLGVVLGNKVNEDGSLSQRLQKRLERALSLYKNGRVKMLFVSGGHGHEGFNEGDKMRDFLIGKGVPAALIITDNQGDNTLKTVKNTAKLKSNYHIESIIVVSQYYHITRTKMLFRKNGFDKVFGASPEYLEWRDGYSLIREFVAFYSELLPT